MKKQQNFIAFCRPMKRLLEESILPQMRGGRGNATFARIWHILNECIQEKGGNTRMLRFPNVFAIHKNRRRKKGSSSFCQFKQKRDNFQVPSPSSFFCFDIVEVGFCCFWINPKAAAPASHSFTVIFNVWKKAKSDWRKEWLQSFIKVFADVRGLALANA